MTRNPALMRGIAAAAFALLWLIACIVLAVASVQPAVAQTATPPRPFSMPKCLPRFLGGAGQGEATYDGPEGVCHGYWCADPAAPGGWAGWQHCRIPGYTAFSLADATRQIAAAGPVTLETFHAFLLRNQQAPTPAGVPFYNRLHAKMDVAMAATKPAPPAPPAPPPPPPPQAWVVDAATSADGTRPAYALANGVRGTAVVGRAQAGQPCKPEVAQSSSSVAGKVFAAFGPNYSAALVALCRKP